MRSTTPWIVVGLLAVTAVATSAEENPADWTDQQKENFLLHAEIIGVETLDIGVTGSQKARMSLGGVTHDAHIQTVDITRKRVKIGPRTEFNYRDCYRFNIAGYRLDRILGLHMVPVSVERRVRGKNAAVTWWVDEVLMTENERVVQGIQPPDPTRWNRQNHRVMVFSELIYNTDLNRGNLLITHGWKIWMIDFSRAFRIHKTLANAERLTAIDSWLLERLRGLSEKKLEEAGLKSCLSKRERAALLARRDRIVRFFESLAAQPDGAGIIYDLVQEDRDPG